MAWLSKHYSKVVTAKRILKETYLVLLDDGLAPLGAMPLTDTLMI